MKALLQGGVRLDFFCTVEGEGEGEERSVENFISLFDLNDLKVKNITIEGSDGRLHTLGIETSEMELDSSVEVDEDTPNKYKDYQIGRLAVSGKTK